MARVSKKTNVNVSLAEAQDAANNYAKCAAKKDSLTAKMNEKLAAIREQYEPEITSLNEQMQEPVEVLESYAIANRDEWGEKKSIELASCVIGFRTSPPKLEKKKGVTWDYIVTLMKTNRLLKPFVRVKEDVDKAALLKLQADEKMVKQMNTLGITIEQDENFYVDTKKEKVA